MEKRLKNKSTAMSRSGFIVLAAGVALIAFGESAIAAPMQRATPSFSDYCRHAKNGAATAPCLDAANLYENGKVGIAFTTMKKAIAAAPNDGNLRMLSGIMRLRLGEAVPAERELRLARKNGASDEAVLPPLFRAMVERHQENQLLSEFPEPPKNATDDIAAHILHGRALAFRSLNRLDEAAAAMDRSLTLRRGPVALCDRADIAIRQGNPALAGKLIDEALQLAPGNGPALIAKLHFLERSGDAAKTLAFSDHILRMYPYNIESHATRVNVFLKLKQNGRAQADLDAMKARSPRAPLVQYYRAVLMSRAGDRKDAYQIIEALPPEFVKRYPEFALQMAEIALDNGHGEMGSNILGNALAASPDMVDVRLRLASLRMTQNSPMSANLLLNPVKDSPDPRVQKLLTEVRARIAKDRAF
ncbi:MAG: tetratricopeptide repeat protein [Rhizomicrobium sp.]